LNSSLAFAVISQLVMMSVSEHCLWQKWSAVDKAIFGLLKKLFWQTFLLERHTVNKHYY